MNFKRMLRDLEKTRAQQAAQAERQQEQLLEEMSRVRQALAGLKAEPDSDPVQAARSRVDTAALASELNQELKRLQEQQRDLRDRQAAVDRNLAKKQAYLENQLNI